MVSYNLVGTLLIAPNRSPFKGIQGYPWLQIASGWIKQQVFMLESFGTGLSMDVLSMVVNGQTRLSHDKLILNNGPLTTFADDKLTVS